MAFENTQDTDPVPYMDVVGSRHQIYVTELITGQTPECPGPELLGPAFYVTTLTPFYDRLELLFNRVVVLSGPALVASNWIVAGGTVTVTVTSVTYDEDTVTLYITEPLGGESLTLSIPSSGITTPAS